MQLTVFRSDVTPPIGYPLCAGWYPSARGISDQLSMNGVVLFPEGQLPIVMAALDWAELSNGEYDLWKGRLAAAAGTQAERVTIHCIHTHDAPWSDRDAQRILTEVGLEHLSEILSECTGAARPLMRRRQAWAGALRPQPLRFAPCLRSHGAPIAFRKLISRDALYGGMMQFPWADEVIDSAALAVRSSLNHKEVVTEIRTGKARVEAVASNRRVMGADGKVKGVRWTQCQDAALRGEPDGVIDPFLKTLSFWNGARKLAVLHFYATHPTSYDRTGMVTHDFVGLARERLRREEGVPHLYFTECAGNITPGKYNDGVADNREVFTQRISAAMRQAQVLTESHSPDRVEWRVEEVHLPPREDQSEACMLKQIGDSSIEPARRNRAALILAYRRRYHAGIPIQLSALHIGDGIVSVHTPGELFIEYQLFAQSLRPEASVVVPSYGDCGPGYITLERSFVEGGYEPTDSFCSGASEAIVRDAIRKLVAKG